MSRPASPGVDIRFGMAAWKYDHLKDTLYPGIPQAQWLEAYARVYDHVELDVLRYMWPSDAPLQAWRNQTPEGFQFIPKLHQHLTHGTGEDFGTVHEWWDAIRPLHDRIPGVLIQMPPAFDASPSNQDLIHGLIKGVGASAFVELRHSSWRSVETEGVRVWRIDDQIPDPPKDATIGVVRFRGSTLDVQGTLQRDRHTMLAEVAGQVVTQPWDTCHIVMTNHFEGSAPLSIDRLAEALGVPAPDRSKAGRRDGQASLF